MATDIEALLAAMEALRIDYGRLFSLDVKAVTRTERKYWPSRYKEPKRRIDAPGPLSESDKGYRFNVGGRMEIHPRGPKTADEAKAAPVFFDMGGRPYVNSAGESMAVSQGWEDRFLVFAVGSGANRFVEVLSQSNELTTTYAGALMGILYPGESVSLTEGVWPGIVNRVGELAGSGLVRPPLWQVSNGRTEWSVEIWRRRDEFSLGSECYSPEDVERIGDEPEWVFADRETFIQDSERAAAWLIEQVKRRVAAAGEPEAESDPQHFDDGLSPDGRTLRWGGCNYPLKPGAAGVVGLLFDAFLGGRFPYLSEDYLKTQTDTETDMRNLVRDNHLVGVVIPEQMPNGKRVNGKWGLIEPQKLADAKKKTSPQ